MKRGFTIAEVLITLGIIGVIAAMTLPGAIASHRSKTLEAQFKKRYSELSQVLLKLQDDQEYIYGLYWTDMLAHFLASNIKGAVAPMRHIYIQAQTTQKRELGYSLPVYKNYSQTAEFPDGRLDDGFVAVNKECFILFNADNFVTDNITIYIDINGLQKPNVFGYDVFAFKFDRDMALKVWEENDDLCDIKSTHAANGLSCSSYAMNDANYFKNLGW